MGGRGAGGGANTVIRRSFNNYGYSSLHFQDNKFSNEFCDGNRMIKANLTIYNTALDLEFNLVANWKSSEHPRACSLYIFVKGN